MLRRSALTAQFVSLIAGMVLAPASTALAQRSAPSVRTTDRIEATELPVEPIRPIADRALPPRFDPQGQRPVIMLTGYWPPTNEAVRRFSADPVKNPLGWIGSNWESRGYDVYAYFPEFNPPNCNNCGRGFGDLEVDYQDTSEDWWRFVDLHKPIAIITFSRGNPNLSWEVEMNQYNRAQWINDYLPPYQPTPVPPDASVPPGHLRLSKLPVQEIVDAINSSGLGLNGYICFSGDGGGFLSEFIAYHGVWYQNINASPASPEWCVSAGHVHVGGLVTWPIAEQAAQVTLRVVMDHVDAIVDRTVVQEDIGYGGPGSAKLVVAGDELRTGGTADLLLYDAPANTRFVILGSRRFNPRNYMGGVVVPLPSIVMHEGVTDADGRYLRTGIEGGRGRFDFYVQAIYHDPSQPQGRGFSNAVRMEFYP